MAPFDQKPHEPPPPTSNMESARRPDVSGPVLSAWRAKLVIARNGVARATRQSPVRVLGMAGMSLATVIGAFLAFRQAFTYIASLEVVGPVILVRLLSLFFFVLFVMLVMSNVLVSFQTLFRSREAEWWAVAPITPADLHHARSAEVVVMSSWAFLFLGGPILIAYGVGTKAAWPFHVLLPLVLVLFVLCAHSLGLAVTVALVRIFPGLDMKRLIALLIIGLAPIAVLLVRAFRVTEIGPDDDVSELLVHVLEGLGRTQYPLLPGYWAAEALRGAALLDVKRAALFTWTLGISALFLGLLAREVSVRCLVPAYQLLRGVGLARPVGSRTRRVTMVPAGGPLRALASKDVTLFFREPAQWAQVLLVSVLALTYVANLRSLPDLSRLAPWGHVASYLNLGVVLLLLSTLTTRFAFPLISMEGRRAWIVLLAPMPRRRIVWQKMLLVFVLAGSFGLASAALSTHVLGVDHDVRIVTLVSALAGAFALSGLAIGLGALIPNFKEDNPARIVTGFGGTLDFLLGLAYVASMTVLLAAPSFLEAIGRWTPQRCASIEPWAHGGAAVLSLLVGVVPLVMGARHLERLEL